MKKQTRFASVLLTLLLGAQTGSSDAAAAGHLVWSERATSENSVFLWSTENLEAVTGWDISQIVSSPLQGKIQAQAKGVCAVRWQVLYLYRAGKCVVSASLKTPGSKKTKYASKTYLVAPSSIPALVAGMPLLENGTLLTKEPGLFMPPDANGQRRYAGGTYPSGPSWYTTGELAYAYSAIWSCREAQDYIPSDCDIMPLIQYFESQGWSVFGKARSSDVYLDELQAWKMQVEGFRVSMRKGNATILFSYRSKRSDPQLVLNDGQIIVRIQIGDLSCLPSIIASNKKLGNVNHCREFSS
jgi:hypothetical protein